MGAAGQEEEEVKEEDKRQGEEEGGLGEGEGSKMYEGWQGLRVFKTGGRKAEEADK